MGSDLSVDGWFAMSWADDPRFEAVKRDGVWIGVCHVCKVESVPVDGWGDNWDSAVAVIHRHQAKHGGQ